MRYWLSWYQVTEDYRPLTYPPNEAILGWWCSGESIHGATLCAVVEACCEEDAWSAVKLDWPEMDPTSDARFISEKSNDYVPGGGRFPIKENDWSYGRLYKSKVQGFQVEE